MPRFAFGVNGNWPNAPLVCGDAEFEVEEDDVLGCWPLYDCSCCS